MICNVNAYTYFRWIIKNSFDYFHTSLIRLFAMKLSTFLIGILKEFIAKVIPFLRLFHFVKNLAWKMYCSLPLCAGMEILAWFLLEGKYYSHTWFLHTTGLLRYHGPQENWKRPRRCSKADYFKIMVLPVL